MLTWYEKVGLVGVAALFVFVIFVLGQNKDEKHTTKEKLMACGVVCEDSAVKAWSDGQKCECE